MSDKLHLSDLSQQLATGLNRAIRSYQSFESAEIPTDAKGFTAYHNACKSALLHIALLLKLIGNKPETESSEMDWIQFARQNLKEADDLFID